MSAAALQSATGTGVSTVHAIGSRRLGGAERFFARLVRALHGTGAPTLAVVRRGSELARMLPPVPVVETGMRNGADVLTAWRIRRIVQSDRPQIVQTYLGRASRLTRVPRRSETVHVARLGGYYRPNSYRHADAWIGNTRGICDYLVRTGFPADRVFHIGNFAEAMDAPCTPEQRSGARAALSLPADALLIFSLGRFVRKKGFEDLLHAFALLPAEVDARPLHLVVAGDGAMRAELRALTERLDISARVHWPGWQHDPAPFYRAADVFVCPSRDEPLGNVVLEAWAHGLPVVATRAAGPTELIDDGANGLLTHIGAPQAMSGAIHRLLEADEAERNAMGKAGLELVRTTYSETAIVASYLQVYDVLANELGRRR